MVFKLFFLPFYRLPGKIDHYRLPYDLESLATTIIPNRYMNTKEWILIPTRSYFFPSLSAISSYHNL
jgi:hypothetical protein